MVLHQARLQPERVLEKHRETLRLFLFEAVGLEAHTCSLRGSIVHQPDGQGRWGHEVLDIGWNDLPPVLVEALPPYREDRIRPRHELDAWIPSAIELLLELMQLHCPQ